MPLYVSLMKYTSEGAKTVDQVGDRYRDNQKLIESRGGKLIAVYALLGEWDLLSVAEFPDDKAAMSTLLTVAKSGRLTGRTMTAVSIEDFIEIAKQA